MPQTNLSLTAEQSELIHWTASLGAITAEALAVRCGLTPASARGRLGALVRRGLLAKRRLLLDAPALYTTTKAGLRACGVYGIDPFPLSPAIAHHASVCARVAAGLERSYPDHRLVGERELRRDERELARPLACARLAGDRTHHPDLILWPAQPGELPVAVEVELTIKAPRRLAAICRAWAACPTVSGVLYLAPERVSRALERAIEAARARERIVVVPLDAVVSPA